MAEIGDVDRFPSARHLCSWAGMTPKLHESDLKSHRGKMNRPGSDGGSVCWISNGNGWARWTQ